MNEIRAKALIILKKVVRTLVLSSLPYMKEIRAKALTTEFI
jgi:hypothetical protein